MDSAIEQLETARFSALTSRDFESLTRLCHPQMRYTHSTGHTDTCATYIDRCRSGFYTYDRVDFQLDSVVVAGDTAVFEETMTADAKVDGRSRSLRTRAMVVWVRTDQTWLFFAYHATAM